MKAVKHMVLQGMAYGQSRVIEIVSRIVRHAKFFHDPERADVSRNSERDDAVESDGLKAKSQYFACAFGCQPFAPMPSCDPPANLNSRHKRCIEAGDGLADEAEEGMIHAKLCRKEAKAVNLKVPLDALHQFV